MLFCEIYDRNCKAPKNGYIDKSQIERKLPSCQEEIFSRATIGWESKGSQSPPFDINF